MNYSTYRASLDIHASGSQAVLHAKKGETKRRILITLTERGKPYLISSDCTAVFTATKPDGNIIYNDCAIDNNIICYNFTEQTTAAEGKLDCEIRLYGADNALIISPGFDLIVDAAVYEDGDVIESGTEVSALTALVSETNTLINTVNTKLENGEFNGPAGEAGGWYTPAVTQPDENTLRVAFTPSKEDMPDVEPKDITLPAGGGGGGSSIAIDETLTKSGQAADAKTVGDRLYSLSEEIVTTAASQVSAHNTGTDTHSDIRLLIQGLTDRLNALADSDDTTLDQLSEVVAYIKSNRSLIEAITTSKVSVADIVDNLTTNASDRPLSAAQGVAIKTLIDALRNNKLDAAELTDAVNTALAQAKASGEFDGADGKSAYQYAVEGGYTGTETAFAEKLAQEQLTGTTNELTPTQVYQAVSAGIPVKVQYTDSTYGLSSFTAFNVSESMNVIASNAILNYQNKYLLAALYGDKSSNVWFYEVTPLAKPSDIPSALPNPNALTFTGAVTGTYDGSAPLSVDIPSGGGGSGGGITGFRRVVDTTLTEDAEIVNLTTDINGNTFSLSECYLFIDAACTAAEKITYIPNGYWTAGTYLISSSTTATDYPYGFAVYACGGSDHFFGFELKHRTGTSMAFYNSDKSAHWKPITSYKLSGKFAKGARFIIFGRDA